MFEEFLRFVNKNGPIPPNDINFGQLDACWVWLKKCRYKFRPNSPHKLSYQYFIGPIPENKRICHKCYHGVDSEEFLCVNPNHLFLGEINDHLKLKFTIKSLRARENFLKLVDKNGPIVSKPNWGLLSPCWIWKGKTSWFSQNPYRVAYTLFIGPIPLNKPLICHKCDHGFGPGPICVNPDHLFAGTQKDNIADCVAKDRLNHYRLAV